MFTCNDTFRRGLVPPFIAMDVLREPGAEAAGHSVIISRSASRGPGPAAVIEAAHAGAGGGPHRLHRRARRRPLRAAIARHYQDQYAVAVDPGDIIVTTGSSAAFQLAFLAAFEPGDRVALATPGYPAYRNILAALGLERADRGR